MKQNLPLWCKQILIFQVLTLLCCTCFAEDDILSKARTLQHDGKYDEAIIAYKNYLSQPTDEDDMTKEEVVMYTDALVQFMNAFQSKGQPEACISALQEIFEVSSALQNDCIRDYYSVMGYALSRTEKMKEAEGAILKAFTVPLRHATPERYFRDYAYAAAVFYSNPNYQNEVIEWCEEALMQARLCNNTSGRQWVSAMLGSLYKRHGRLNKALELFLQSKDEALEKNDDLGVLNSLHSLIDLFLYWDVPEYADLYASEAIRTNERMTSANPMVSAQTYINKGRALLQLGKTDSVSFYTERARKLCQSLPYNSGMVDVDLLHGIYLTEAGGDSLHWGIQELQLVAKQGTAVTRAKACHQLALTYLKTGQTDMAELILDDMYGLLNRNGSTIYIPLNYEPILNHYYNTKNYHKVEQYTRMMLQEQHALKEKKLNYNLVEAITEMQKMQHDQELKIVHLEQTNQRLWFLIWSVISLIIISAAVALFIYQHRQHKKQIRLADEKMNLLVQQLNQSNEEKALIAQEINEIMNDKDSRQELETLTPSILQKDGESKFRQRFEILYPLFLPRLREKVPSITRREELLSMLIVLKQDNKEIADLLAIAPRSVLMLRHRFRQKIGMNVDSSLEEFIEAILGIPFQSDDKPV